MRIAHIVNPFRARPGSEHEWVQPISWETLRRAQSQAQADGIEVTLYAVTFADEQDCVPEGFVATEPLARSILDLGDFGLDQRMPLLRDILERLDQASDADLFVYTNSDIALMPGFYRFVAATYASGTDAFIINRRTIPGHYRRITQLDQMMAEVGTAHSGYDCFIFPRQQLADYDLGDVCIGQTGVGRALLLNMLAHARHFVLYRDLHLTFHIGNDCRWGTPNHPYRLHNFNENLKIMRQLAAARRLPDHPLVRRALNQMRKRFAEAGEEVDLSLAQPAPLSTNTAPDAGAGLAGLFLCQPGQREIETLLLAHGLRRQMPGMELVACVPLPESDGGTLDAGIREALLALGVRVAVIKNPVGEKQAIGNQPACLGVSTQAKRRVLIDTDYLCVAPFAEQLAFAESFAAKPAEFALFDDPRVWQGIYQAAGLFPWIKWVRATISGQNTPLHFHSGVLVCDDGGALADAWMQYAERIDGMPDVPHRDTDLARIALPVAVAALELETHRLDDELNFPAQIRPLTASACLVHYQSPRIIAREPRLRALVQDAVADLPILAERIAKDPDWAALLAPPRVPPPQGPPSLIAPRRNLIISGIPRSGTSYLCAALHAYRDCVVINEPEEIFPIIGDQAKPWGIPVLYQELRQRVLSGVPITNKVEGNRMVEDTSRNDASGEYLPEVGRQDFLLGTKNTLMYLSRLDAIKQAMPGARIVLCIRDPADTIASWITSFPHLKNANLATNPLVGAESRFLDPAQRGALRAVASFQSPAWRRAALWAYLAGLVRKHAEGAMVLSYADLMSAPEQQTERIVGACFNGKASRSSELPVVRLGDKRSVLSEEDHQAIAALCREPAEALGLQSGVEPARPKRAGGFANWLRRK